MSEYYTRVFEQKYRQMKRNKICQDGKTFFFKTWNNQAIHYMFGNLLKRKSKIKDEKE